MISQAFPKDFQRYLALPVFGPLMDRYAAWLFERQYTYRSTRYELRMSARVCAFLSNRGIRQAEEVNESDLQACCKSFRRKFLKEEGSVRVLTRFLIEHSVVQPSPAPKPSPKEIHLNAFMDHLLTERGYASSTVKRQAVIVSEFLDFLKFEETSDRFASLKIADIEDFIKHMGKRMDMGSTCTDRESEAGKFL
jgi:hypothetical protein